MNQKKYLLTTAMIYANGDLHLGHLVENIRADVFKRFQKMLGHHCLLIGGSDCHGTPIMLNAEKQGITPEQLIEKSRTSQQQDLKDFHIDFDNFYLTHSPENKTLSAEIYKKCEAKGDVEKREIQQAYDPIKNMFLPDRYIKGECPKCHTKDQYGDNCESCGATYDPTDLINPKSMISDATPIEKKSEHYFFKLQNYQTALKNWINQGHLQPQIANKLQEWFETGLKAWDISRDAPYFGFEIPGVPGKYLYVWLDAPIGYLASLKNYCDTHDDAAFDDYFTKGASAELYHFIGKDIINFHALFWPAMLMSAELRTPTGIKVNGFLTLNGAKLSKSRSNFINARDYLNLLSPTYLRYYLAAKLNSNVEDIDLNLEDFMLRVNSDLIGKYINIASRSASFINKKFNNQLSDCLDNPTLIETLLNSAQSIAQNFETLDYSHAIRDIMTLADQANQYIAEKAPWQMIKDEGKQAETQRVCTTALNAFLILTTYLKPVIPEIAEKVEVFLNIAPLTWQSIQTPLLNHTICQFKPLLGRIEQSQLDALLPA